MMGRIWQTSSLENHIKLLLDVGADANAKDKRGETALRKAMINGNRHLINLLREAAQ